MKDYYAVLGVEKTATKDDIRKAFTRLAHKYHPDKKGGNESKFKEVNEAYQVLSDDAKRRQYDHVGTGGPGMGGTGGWDFSNFSGADGAGINFDFGDIFSDFFNNSGRGGGQRVRRGRDISVDIQIPFTEAVFGTERNVLITKVGTCDTCKGSGASASTGLKTCATCNGKGQIQETRRSFLGNFTTARECETCHGSGQVPEKPCATCHGRGVLRKTEEVKITIPAGTDHGEMIRLSQRGEAIPSGVAGDLYVRVHVEPHQTFKRDGHNLTMNLEIKLSDALLGAEYPIKTLDGQITLKIPEGINYGEILRVKNQGVPQGHTTSKRGDLLIRIITKTPTKLSKKARNLVEELKGEGV